MRKIRSTAFALLASSILLSALARAEPSPVVLIMLDGVRWQEFFHGVDPAAAAGTGLADHAPIFTQAWSRSPDFVAGRRADGAGRPMKISNPVKISLPAYQSVFAGQFTGCVSNECPRTTFETFPEALVTGRGFRRQDVAAFASWTQIEFAVQSRAGTIFSNAGPHALGLPGFEDLDEEMLRHPAPWADCRMDAVTFEAGLRYVQNHRPRFVYVSLNDTDEYAHGGDYRAYAQALREDDARVQRLLDTLATMGEYGRGANVIVTTDHGRGFGGNWRNHGDWVEGAEWIWMAANGPYFRALPAAWAGKARWEHADIRPLIEDILLR